MSAEHKDEENYPRSIADLGMLDKIDPKELLDSISNIVSTGSGIGRIYAILAIDGVPEKVWSEEIIKDMIKQLSLGAEKCDAKSTPADEKDAGAYRKVKAHLIWTKDRVFGDDQEE